MPSFAVTARTTAGDASSKTPTCALQTNTDTARPAICMRPRPQACTRRKVTRLSPMARFSNISMKKSVRFLNVFLKQDESNANTIVVIHNNSNTRPTHTHKHARRPQKSSCFLHAEADRKWRLGPLRLLFCTRWVTPLFQKNNSNAGASTSSEHPVHLQEQIVAGLPHCRYHQCNTAVCCRPHAVIRTPID